MDVTTGGGIAGGNATLSVKDVVGNDSVAPTVSDSVTVGAEAVVVADGDVVLLLSATVWEP